MITRYELFQDRVRGLYDRIKTSILMRLAYETPLFSFDMFNAYAQVAGPKIDEVYSIVMLLTSEKGVYHACAELDEVQMGRWTRVYHRDVYPTSSWSSSYDDVRLSH